MKIRAEFDESVGVRTSELDWVPSPMADVDRRMLDRIGGEVARATSLVRYAKGSHFSAHTHSGGEEFIVLEGVFRDEHGDYPAGTYIRNPIGTRHIPRSDEGCTIFVKLWQFEPDDQRQFSLDLNALETTPVEEQAGISRVVLHDIPSETVLLEHWQPGASRHFDDKGGAELLILNGSVAWQGQSYGKHDWIRLSPGEGEHISASDTGAKVWIKTGHLNRIARDGWQTPQQD